nr:hypothetical protein [Tanacetum cinerariifolium]
MVAKDDEISKEKEIGKLMALISLFFKKIYKPTNNNLRISSNTGNAIQDNSLRINRVTGYDNQRAANVAGARKTVAYHKENVPLCKQEEGGIQLSVEQVDWRDDTDDEPKDQELGAHYMYMAKIQKVTPNVADNSGPVFDLEPLRKVIYDKDSYNVFANDRQHPEQPESVNDTPGKQGYTNITTDSLNMSINREEADQDNDDDLVRERDLLAI